MLQSMQSLGLAYDPDMFAHGDRSHGCGHVVRTVSNGIRTTAADFLTKTNRRPNISIITGAHVDRVLIEPQNDALVAVGVRAVLESGHVVDYTARKESGAAASWNQDLG
ncbi:hypothetical protein CDD82_5060 [Ophiocordyceps australis]|uniref:Glucose-methanol-choline oxidoreductase N-terminal domain-containing protein n=1 Tax=Ophiocordyceps australis TaxID=1399860 RepID=A0A2C5Z2Z7_9HYPO|nr:hypothetical protein CDD82_5060 [Ophiocordyceps australis]